MKLTLMIMIVCMVQVSASVYSQSVKFSFDFHNKQIRDVLKEIEEQSDYRFFYQEEQVDVEREVNIRFSDKTVDEILGDLFKNRGISFRILNDNMILLTSDFSNKTGGSITQQTKNITGKVTDSSGAPLPGVTVVVKGTTQGIITDTDGNYSLSKIPADATLVFSFVGMKTQEMPVSGKTSVNVTLIEETVGIEEVVAIGYGTTSKRKLTSAVSTVKGEDIVNYPISNTLQALEGRAKGVITMGQGGEPGTLPIISIRGGGEPLYVIDGIPSSKEEFAGISPTDIESFSILKDASAAAVYGARAGNGIVMVTTKKGNQGNIKVTYNTSVSFSSPTTPIKFLSPQQTAEAFDKASLYNGGLVTYMNLDEMGNLYWDPARLDSLNRGILIKNLGVTDWNSMIMNKFAPSQTHDIAMSGGTKSTRYYMSGRYSEQNGIFKNDVSYSKRYAMRMNMSHEFENIGLKVTGDVSLNQQDKKMPPSSLWTIMTSLMRQNSLGRIFNQEGNPTGGSENPYLMIDPKGGYKKSNYKYLNTRLTFDWAVPFVKGLSFQVFGNYRWYDEFHKNWYANASGVGQSWDNLNQKEDMGPAHLDQRLIRSHDYNFESRVNYLKTFAEHHTIQATFVYNEWAENYSYMDAARSGYQTTVIEQLDGGPSSTATNAGSETEHARRGIIGRLKYDYNTRYVLETNFRYDGSDKFPKGSRWGFFPSVSVGWNIDQENFIQNIQSISSLKLRASWGEIGLDDVGDFQYLSVFNAGHDFYQDGKWTPTLSEGNLVSNDLTWYTKSTINIGGEFGLFHNKLNGEFDYFYYRTTGYLASPTGKYSTPLGKSLPTIKTNSAHRRVGWELGLNWQDKIRQFLGYNVGVNMSRYEELWESKYDETDAVLHNPLTRLTHQKSYYDIMYVAKGLYNSMEEIINNPRPTAATELRPGDIQYADINGDGVIDGNDQIRQGRPKFPHFMYGINMGAKWKGIALELLFQGTGRRDIMLESYTRRYTTGQIGMIGSDNFWNPSNISNPIYPRYTGDMNTNGGNNMLNSTYWLKNGTYLRLKNIKLSYDLTRRVLKKTDFVKEFQVYASGYNLLTFSHLEKYNLDPESGRDGEETSTLGYPVQKLYNFGVIVSF